MDLIKKILDVKIFILFTSAIGGNIIYLVLSIVSGDMKKVLIAGAALLLLTTLFAWHANKKKSSVRRHRPPPYQPGRKIYRIKKVVDPYDLPDIVAQYDFCLFQDRSILNGEFEMLVYVRNSDEFNILANYLEWKIEDPLKLIFRAKSSSYKEVSELITDVLGTTLVS